MSPVWSSVFFLCAVANFWVYGVTHDTMQAGLGVMMGVLGVVYAFGSVLVIEGHAVQVKNAFGMTMRTYVFRTPHDLAVDGRKLWVQMDDRRAKVSGVLASAKDWRTLRETIAEAQQSAPRQ